MHWLASGMIFTGFVVGSCVMCLGSGGACCWWSTTAKIMWGSSSAWAAYGCQLQGTPPFLVVKSSALRRFLECQSNSGYTMAFFHAVTDRAQSDIRCPFRWRRFRSPCEQPKMFRPCWPDYDQFNHGISITIITYPCLKLQVGSYLCSEYYLRTNKPLQSNQWYPICGKVVVGSCWSIRSQHSQRRQVEIHRAGTLGGFPAPAQHRPTETHFSVLWQQMAAASRTLQHNVSTGPEHRYRHSMFAYVFLLAQVVCTFACMYIGDHLCLFMYDLHACICVQLFFYKANYNWLKEDIHKRRDMRTFAERFGLFWTWNCYAELSYLSHTCFELRKQLPYGISGPCTLPIALVIFKTNI